MRVFIISSCLKYRKIVYEKIKKKIIQIRQNRQ